MRGHLRLLTYLLLAPMQYASESETIIIIFIYFNINIVIYLLCLNMLILIIMYIIYMQTCIMISECYGQNTTTKQEVPFECIVI